MIAPASRRLGKYEIRQKLGRGGMADVYLAHDSELDCDVALKLIEHAADADTRDFIEAERRGAELEAHLAAIDPRVVRVYDCGDVDGFFFVAMEYIDGQDLSELMRHGPLAVEFATDTAIAVAQTLENAHNLQVAIEGKDFQGIVHGDIKPRNIRIDARGEVRVLDFGIAKALSLSRRLTRNEFGSVPYASPERLDSGQVDALSDLWSLAVMLYEMVTGMQPYQAASTELLERMIHSRIPPPPAPDPCPEPLRLILMKAMSPDPAVRYPTARSLTADLAAFRKGEPVAAASEDLDATRRTFRQAADDGDATRRTTNRPSASKTAARSRPSLPNWARGVLAVLVLAVVVYGVWVMVSDYRFYERGIALQREIMAEQLTGPDQVWARWTELSQGNPSSLFLHGPRSAVKQKLVEAANHVIDTYRNDSQPVYENDWKTARTELAHALAADPDDRSVRGKLRLCDGHLARINGQAHRSPTELNDAVEKFTEAQQLLPQLPDPYLGLARVYVYGLRDIDKANDALQQAEKRGFPLGNREKLQLADGYSDRGNLVWWDSRNIRGLPQEKDQIQRAADDYKRALELYQSIAPYGGAATKITQIQSSLDSVNFRLQQLEHAELPPILRLLPWLKK